MKKSMVVILVLLTHPIFVHANLLSKDLSRDDEIEQFVVELKAPVNESALENLKAVSGVLDATAFIKSKSKYFQRLVSVTTNSSKAKARLSELAMVKKLESVFPLEQNLEHRLGRSIVPSTGGSINTMSVVVGQNPIMKTNDSLFPYQWALHNNGQIVYRDISDIKPEKILGVSGVDIGWDPKLKPIDHLFKKDVVVAVLDYGLNVTHPDIVNNLYLNEAECVRGKVPRGEAKEDKDGNGFNGDCIGWNFAESNHKTRRNRVVDRKGHGTHVAGIIAAEKDNDYGISGLSNHIKILPVKVISMTDDRDGGEKGLSLTDRVAKGIIYAIERGADVINLSMGWPIRFNADYLSEAFAEAARRNVTIVAAVGNNDNSGQIFPCAFKSVICVGAIRNDGKVADFSNFGGHVDILAPGDNILSLFPRNETPLNFSVDNFDIKSGTSQAAPYIAAMVASLKGVHPGIQLNEIRSRLYTSAQAVQSKRKYSMHGLARLDKMLNAEPKLVVRPVFKELGRVAYNRVTKRFSLKLPVKSYWRAASSVTVEVSSLSSNIQVLNKKFTLGALSSGEEKIVELNGRVLDDSKHSEFLFSVNILASNVDQGTFKHQIIITRNIESDPSVKHIPIRISDEVNSLSKLNLRTMKTHQRKSVKPEYYRVIEEKDGDELKGLNFQRWNIKSSELVKDGQLYFTGARRVVSVMKVDANYDGQLDYVFRLGIQRGEDFFLEYAFYNNKLEPLFGKYSHWNLEYEGVQLNFRSLRWLPLEVSELGRVAVPVFQANGFIPNADINPKVTDFEVNQPADRVYFFEPQLVDGKVRLITRNFNNYKFDKSLVNQLSLRYYHGRDVLSLAPQSHDDFYNGHLQLLLSTGVDNNRTYSVLDVNGKELIENSYRMRPTYYGYELLDNLRMIPVIDLSSTIPDFESSSSFVGMFSTISSSVSFLEQDIAQFKRRTNYMQNDEKDHLVSFIQAYQQDNKLFGFYQSKSSMILQVTEGESTQIFQQPLKRSEFWDCMKFNTCFYPVISGSSKLKKPALYVDETQLSGRHVYSWVGSSNGLNIPIRSNVEVSAACKPRNPIGYGEGGVYAYSFLCRTETGWELQFLTID